MQIDQKDKQNDKQKDDPANRIIKQLRGLIYCISLHTGVSDLGLSTSKCVFLLFEVWNQLFSKTARRVPCVLIGELFSFG